MMGENDSTQVPPLHPLSKLLYLHSVLVICVFVSKDLRVLLTFPSTIHFNGSGQSITDLLSRT